MNRRYAFIASKKEEGHHAKVSTLCDVVGVSNGTWYRWQSGRGKRTERHEHTEELLAKIRTVWEDSDFVYGSPRVYAQLRIDGIHCNHKRVEKLMQEHGMFSHAHWHSPSTTRAGLVGGIPDLLERHFNADAPNTIWWTDITAIRSDDGWVYLSAIEDVYSRKVVGYALANHQKTTLPMASLKMALRERQPEGGLIHHSDRGCQYTSWIYQNALLEHGLRSNMGRTGVCWDNAAAESFWSSLKKEKIYRKQWKTRYAVRKAVKEYIAWYNAKRLHSTLGQVSPDEFEQRYAA